MICAKCSYVGSFARAAVESKGTDPHAIAYLVGWIKGLGYKRVVATSERS